MTLPQAPAPMLPTTTPRYSQTKPINMEHNTVSAVLLSQSTHPRSERGNDLLGKLEPVRRSPLQHFSCRFLRRRRVGILHVDLDQRGLPERWIHRLVGRYRRHLDVNRCL